MSTVTSENAQAHLKDLIAQLRPGEDISITQHEEPVARLTAEALRNNPPRRLATLKGTVLYMAPDFDAPLDDFKEYME